MIYVKICGGLGNQMFQYATARSLAIKRGTDVRLDASILSGPQKSMTKRQLGLYFMNIQAKIATTDELNDKFELDVGHRSFLNRLYSKLKTRKEIPCNILKEQIKFVADERVLHANDNVYLDGYWQSERYFLSARVDLLKEFKVKNKVKNNNLILLNRISNTNSVSIHVRGGDYISNPKAKERYGICSKKYYEEAMAFIQERVHNPKYFVFSDDFTYARNMINLNSDNVEYLEHNGDGKNFEDLRLMRNCKYNIIANSSFSWWGAWLNSFPSKIVICPYPWFDVKEDFSELIPKSWIQLSKY